MFQSTLPRGERRDCRGVSIYCRLFQSTLPRGERPAKMLVPSITEIVSIHAPAWGATLTPAGAFFTWSSFNPRSRVGSDITLGY